MPILGIPTGVPAGTIAIWLNTIITIPSGWRLCDGTNGTPNLTNRFPKCVPNTGTNPGATGGTDTEVITTSQIPAHIHAFSVPNHQHDGQDNCQAPSGSPVTLPLVGSVLSSFELDISSTATITSISSTGSSSPHTNIPKCKTVLYIQKK